MNMVISLCPELNLNYIHVPIEALYISYLYKNSSLIILRNDYTTLQN